MKNEELENEIVTISFIYKIFKTASLYSVTEISQALILHIFKYLDWISFGQAEKS